MNKINWLENISDDAALDVSHNFWKHLSEHAYPLSKGTMRIPISFEPYVLTQEKYHDLESQVNLLISGAKKLAQKFYHDRELEEVFAIDEQERALIYQSKNDPLVGIVRVDLFHGEQPKIVEINADFPDGFFMHDVTSSAIKNMISAHELHHASNTELFIELLKSEYVKPNDHIFVGYNGERQFRDEFALTKIKLNEAGWNNISVGAFEDLDYRNGIFFFESKQIDVIRRGAELSKLREIPHLLDQLAKAQQVSGLKIVNNFKMRLLGHKSLLAALHDERFAKYLTMEELTAIKMLVPLTRKLRLEDILVILDEKDRWVLKPSDLAEGTDVVIGSSCAQEKWETLLRRAAENPSKWIVQEKITIPEHTFTLIDGSKTPGRTHVNAYYDLDPHIVLFKEFSKFGNMLVRFSSSEILNVMKGGGLTYAFYIKNTKSQQ